METCSKSRNEGTKRPNLGPIRSVSESETACYIPTMTRVLPFEQKSTVHDKVDIDLRLAP